MCNWSCTEDFALHYMIFKNKCDSSVEESTSQETAHVTVQNKNTNDSETADDGLDDATIEKGDERYLVHLWLA